MEWGLFYSRVRSRFGVCAIVCLLRRLSRWACASISGDDWHHTKLVQKMKEGRMSGSQAVGVLPFVTVESSWNASNPTVA